MSEFVNENDVGVLFKVTAEENDAVVDIATATALAIIFKKPSGVEVERVASLFTDGTDGILKYANVADEFDELGEWSYIGKVTFSASLVFYSRPPAIFMVE